MASGRHLSPRSENVVVVSNGLGYYGRSALEKANSEAGLSFAGLATAGIRGSLDDGAENAA